MNLGATELLIVAVILVPVWFFGFVAVMQLAREGRWAMVVLSVVAFFVVPFAALIVAAVGVAKFRDWRHGPPEQPHITNRELRQTTRGPSAVDAFLSGDGKRGG